MSKIVLARVYNNMNLRETFPVPGCISQLFYKISQSTQT